MDAGPGEDTDASVSNDDGGRPMPLECEGGDGRCLFVISSIAPSLEDELGRVEGNDIDGRISDSTDPLGCHHDDWIAPDGRGGLDNQLASLEFYLELLEIPLQPGFDAAIREGQFLFAIELRDANGQTDPDVRVDTYDPELPPELAAPGLAADGTIAPGQARSRSPASGW